MDEVEKPVKKAVTAVGGGDVHNRTFWFLLPLLLAAGATPLPSLAGSNLAGGYPVHQCGDRPLPPERPDEFRTREELDAYNEKVHDFNASMERYIDCLQNYVDNAAADIRLIRETIKAAMDAVKP